MRDGLTQTLTPTHTNEGLRAAQSIGQDHPQVGVLVFSQYIETRSAAELFADSPASVGYLLKTNGAIASMLTISPGVVEKRVASVSGASNFLRNIWILSNGRLSRVNSCNRPATRKISAKLTASSAPGFRGRYSHHADDGTLPWRR